MQTNSRLEEKARDRTEFRVALDARHVVDFEIAAAAAGWSVADTGERIMTDTDDEVILTVSVPPTTTFDDPPVVGWRRAAMAVPR